ncbi:MAG TPA: hypothetical protein DCE41_23780, partial [Cytophagales bacterium]|nr:hypothetical protein [Cytophagales bacterium]
MQRFLFACLFLHIGFLELQANITPSGEEFSIKSRDRLNQVPTVVHPIPDTTLPGNVNLDPIDLATVFSDPDGDVLTYSVSYTAPELSIKLVGSQLLAYVGPNFYGSDVVMVSAQDGQASATHSFVITRNPEHTAPMLLGEPDPVVILEDSEFAYSGYNFEFFDPDGDLLVLSSPGQLPDWLYFDESSVMFRGTPDDSDVGTIAVTVEATDLFGLSAQGQLLLTILPVNDAPVLADTSFSLPIGSGPGAPVGTLAVQDPDSETFTFTLDSGNVGGTFALDPTGELTLIYTEALDADATFTLAVLVEDDSGAIDTGRISVDLARPTHLPLAQAEDLLLYPNPAQHWLHVS